jgi:hypothetical protein
MELHWFLIVRENDDSKAILVFRMNSSLGHLSFKETMLVRL